MSTNRQQRRIAKKVLSKESNPGTDALTTQGWDELKVVAQHCFQLNQSSAEVIPFIRNQELNRYIDDPDTHRQELNAMSKACERLTHQLNAIFDKHKDRSGGMSEDELILCLQINEEYNTWQEEYQTDVLPLISVILTRYSHAADRLAASTATS